MGLIRAHNTLELKDNLCTFNEGDEFVKTFPEIHPQEIHFKSDSHLPKKLFYMLQ